MSEQAVYVEGELFVGRLDEQDYFRGVLRAVLAPQDDDAPPFLFLLHGEGGMGKSQLTRRMRDIALDEAPFEGSLHVLRVDWEEVRFHTPALRIARDLIHPETVLAALHRAALEAGWGRHFDAYQKTLKQREKADKEVAQAVEQLAGEGRYTAIRNLGATGLAKFVRLALPAVGQTGEDLARNLLAAGVRVGAEQIAQLRGQAEGFLQARLKPELHEVYRQPHAQLARALGEGLHRVGRGKPLLLLLDTYEIIAVADRWLRQAIRAAGPRVVWVISGRDNLAPSRPGDRYVGYSAEFPRRLTAWDTQELAIDYVEDYLRDRAPERETTREDAAGIHRATLGVPLALRQAADLWARDVPLSAITEGTPDYAPREEIVRLMCERVLMHVQDDEQGQADRRALYLLAMQPRPDAEVQAAVLRPADGPFDLRQRLDELARRYSAVRLVGGARLHDAMGAFVREYLLNTEAGASDAVGEVAKSAIAALRARRAELDDDMPGLAERVESEDWGQAALDLAHWLFWLKERDAWRELVPRFVEGLGYDRDLAQGLLDVVEVFRRALGRDGRKRPKLLDLSAKNRETLLGELDKLARRGWLDGADADQNAERRAILDLWRGRWLVEGERYGEALKVYLEVERRMPAEAIELKKQLGQAFNELSNHFLWPEGAADAVPSEPGLQAAQRAVELDVENSDAWHSLGAALYRLNHYEEAVVVYQRAVELDPKLAYPWNGLGAVYCDQGRHEEAIVAYQRALELDPKLAAPWNGLGVVYHDQGRHEEAIGAFQRTIELDPKLAAPWHGLGNVYRTLGRHEEAIGAYQRALELDPKYAYPWHGLGSVYNDQGRHEEAIGAYQRALELDPKDAYPWNGLGNVYRDLGRHEEAIGVYQRALELDPKFVYPWNGLGVVYGTQGCHEEAIGAFQRALELDPKYATPWHGLGAVYHDQGRHEKAIGAYQRAVELNPKFAPPHTMLGSLYELEGRLNDALREHQRAVELQPDDGMCRNSLASVLRKLGRETEAAEHLARARELMQNENAYNKACIEAIAGDAEAALEHLARALAQAPGLRDWARRDPDLASLRGDPRFEALVGE